MQQHHHHYDCWTGGTTNANRRSTAADWARSRAIIGQDGRHLSGRHVLQTARALAPMGRCKRWSQHKHHALDTRLRPQVLPSLYRVRPNTTRFNLSRISTPFPFGMGRLATPFGSRHAKPCRSAGSSGPPRPSRCLGPCPFVGAPSPCTAVCAVRMRTRGLPGLRF